VEKSNRRKGESSVPSASPLPPAPVRCMEPTYLSRILFIARYIIFAPVRFFSGSAAIRNSRKSLHARRDYNNYGGENCSGHERRNSA